MTLVSRVRRIGDAPPSCGGDDRRAHLADAALTGAADRAADTDDVATDRRERGTDRRTAATTEDAATGKLENRARATDR